MPASRLYALVDCLLVRELPDLCRQHGWPAPLSVYAGSPGYDSGRDWAPHLLELPHDLNQLAQHTATLVSRCSGLPALGVLVSRHPAPVVQAQLMRTAGITDGSGKRWLLRFADTRVWPPAPGWLNAEQQAHAFAGIGAWIIVNRHGQAQSFDGAPDAEPARPDEPVEDFRVTERQLIQLFDVGEPDQHLARMAENPYHAQLARSPIEQYDTVHRALATLDRIGIDDDQQRFLYARFAVRFAGDCEQDPAVQQALLCARHKEGILSDLLTRLPR
ncbi:hypothetical protein BKK79_21605 [Cupriavidus sp. USMAA2-4]|uniref:DUF4123 domain-containing protein n=1 Tax=Cupriavidus sp. USMAA2-4 TaxID=876364 RepID=UPI0008A66A27|nr:DUF4123 domain-containing protein [Cupriavidus sp. USMAA2-4]AOY94537.1 hypothetical protein BKK79_21605 [Cupriavidus sp. USMAA2-4]